MRKKRAGGRTDRDNGLSHLIKENKWIDAYRCPGYQVSDTGLFRSLKRTMIRSNGRKHTIPERVMKGSKDTKGYIQVWPYIDGKRKGILIHRLVYQSFVRPLEDLEQIDHIDSDKENNNLNNLQPLKHMEHYEVTLERQIEILKEREAKAFKEGIEFALKVAEECCSCEYSLCSACIVSNKLRDKL